MTEGVEDFKYTDWVLQYVEVTPRQILQGIIIQQRNNIIYILLVVLKRHSYEYVADDGS